MTKPNYLNFKEAVTKSLELAVPTKLSQKVSLNEAGGKVLAKDVICQKNLPAFNNSAMDGYACRFEDLGKSLHITKTIYAGDKGVVPSLGKNQCYKIMTGAYVPSDADTIIPYEKCICDADTVKVPKDVKKGANLRLKGEEQELGSVLLKQGESIKAAHIALLASQGIMMVEVYKPLSIAVISTGNELKEPWEKSDEEEIYNCNSYALLSILKENGFDGDYCGVLPDNLQGSVKYIEKLKNYDVIITSGGISLGEADFMYEAFLKNGLTPAFHGVNIKPGRPIMMGKMSESFVMSLPGNPLTAMINLSLFSIPVLRKMQGNKAYYQDFIKATNTQDFKTKTGRVNIVLGHLEQGKFTPTRANKYGSGMISAFYESNCLLVSNENKDGIKAKEEVKLIELKSSYLSEQVDVFN